MGSRVGSTQGLGWEGKGVTTPPRTISALRLDFYKRNGQNSESQGWYEDVTSASKKLSHRGDGITQELGPSTSGGISIS